MTIVIDPVEQTELHALLLDFAAYTLLALNGHERPELVVIKNKIIAMGYSPNLLIRVAHEVDDLRRKIINTADIDMITKQWEKGQD